jgi:predicted nucleic acid-binding protein
VALEAWLDHDLALRFSGRILPVDLGVAERWGEIWGRICGSAAAKKSPIPVIDALLAATALHYDLTLVSRDLKHASISRVSVFDPWTG